MDFHHRWVEIASSPNTEFIRSLFESLGLHTRVYINRGYGYVGIFARDAARMRIFNPEVLTYRRRKLEKLVGAKVFRAPWPVWLKVKLRRLLADGLSDRKISETILEEDNVYVRIRSIKGRRTRSSPAEAALKLPRTNIIANS